MPIAKLLTRCLDKVGNVKIGQIAGSTLNVVENNSMYGSLWLTDEIVEISQILPPLDPIQILGFGLNYRKHAMETNLPIPTHPVMFMKSVHSVIGPNDTIVLPKSTLEKPEVDFEGELAVIIKQDCLNVSETEAMDCVLGYTIANDVSARRWQGKRGGGQWCRAKSFNTFCPLGPAIATKEHVSNPNALQLTTTLNGKTMQDSNTSDMIFSISKIVSELSQNMVLAKGTVILTGTPEVVDFMYGFLFYTCIDVGCGIHT